MTPLKTPLPDEAAITALLHQVYHLLFERFGARHWWPARTPFEMAVGAVLTQNTAWSNVEKAILNLQRADALQLRKLHALPVEDLQTLIRPAGFFRQKSERLQLFTAHLLKFHQGELLHLLAQPLDLAREELLDLKGIGPETADSILLYAGGHASFVVDAYTRRLLERLNILPGEGRYQQMRELFMTHLPADARLFNEFHAQIVTVCKQNCHKRRPRCETCPLEPICPTGKKNSV